MIEITSTVLTMRSEKDQRRWDMKTFLAPFYHITNLIYGYTYPTSSLFFKHIVIIEMMLNELKESLGEVIKDIASRMKVIFVKIENIIILRKKHLCNTVSQIWLCVTHIGHHLACTNTSIAMPKSIILCVIKYIIYYHWHCSSVDIPFHL